MEGGKKFVFVWIFGKSHYLSSDHKKNQLSVSNLVIDLPPHQASWIQPELSKRKETLHSSNQASGPRERSRSTPGQGVNSLDQPH